MNLPILNIAAYKFVELSELGEPRKKLREYCRAQGLRGTILLRPGGINLFLAGLAERVEALVTLLHALPELTDLEVKRSWSASIPFAGCWSK